MADPQANFQCFFAPQRTRFLLFFASQMARERGKSSSSNNSASLGFEAKLWLAVDKLRSNMDAAEYKYADTFRRDLHPDLRADFVLANPPFNDSDWFRKDDDPRWQFGLPPRGNPNFGWLQHFIHHFAPHGWEQ